MYAKQDLGIKEGGGYLLIRGFNYASKCSSTASRKKPQRPRPLQICIKMLIKGIAFSYLHVKNAGKEPYVYPTLSPLSHEIAF